MFIDILVEKLKNVGYNTYCKHGCSVYQNQKKNAKYDAQGKINNFFNSHKTGLTIGSFPNTKSIWNLNGVLDEMRIYNRLLSESEMEELNQKHN